MNDNNEEQPAPEATGFYSDSEGGMFLFDPVQLDEDVRNLTALLITHITDTGAVTAASELQRIYRDSGPDYTRYLASQVAAVFAKYVLEVPETFALSLYLWPNFQRFVFAYRVCFGRTDLGSAT